ncbi:MAG: hypothetical protein FJ267_04960 [Planctomycetes bacterium]|nr:hypothetical protein [Planctomycetota bacterium]
MKRLNCAEDFVALDKGLDGMRNRRLLGAESEVGISTDTVMNSFFCLHSPASFPISMQSTRFDVAKELAEK